MELPYFLLYSHNIVVEGKERSAIYDLQNEALVFIPNVLVMVLKALKEKPVAKVIADLCPNQPELIKQYVQFLLKKDLGFYTKNPADFPPLDFEYEPSSVIQSAVLEYSIADQLYAIEDLVIQLNGLLCTYVELRITDKEVKATQILKLVEAFSSSTVSSLHLIVPNQGLSTDDLKKIYTSNNKIQDILVHNAVVDAILPAYPDNIVFSKENLFSDEQIKPFPQDQHIVNILFFSEAQHYNVYYNRKVCIAVNGDVKNCLWNKKRFGNINQQTLLSIVETAAFQELWTINADQIKDVKDSPLRYCTLYSAIPKKTEDGLYQLV